MNLVGVLFSSATVRPSFRFVVKLFKKRRKKLLKNIRKTKNKKKDEWNLLKRSFRQNICSLLQLNIKYKNNFGQIG